MRALRFSSGRLEVIDIPKPSAAGEAVVRVLLSGICNTDLEIAKGYAEFQGTIGHEFVGVVERADDAPQLLGKRVVGEINTGCGSCEKCIAGDPRHCATRTVLGIVARDGAHAEYLSLPSRNLVVVPDVVTDAEAVFTEPLAAAYGITERVEIGPSTRVVVIGDGKLGLLCAMSLSVKSNNLMLVGKHGSKLDIARASGIEAYEREHFRGGASRQFDVVIEASGSEGGFVDAVELVKPRGTIVLKSTFHGTPTWPASRIVVDEITVVGSRCGHFAPALDLLADKVVNVEPLIHGTYPLSAGLAAMDRAGQPGTLKILLDAAN
jgi:threonine dehydrogenase-like Zn-dependent dehydrogenase